MSKSPRYYEILPYDIIASAVCGEADAMEITVRHYAGYIMALSTKISVDENGVRHARCDESLRKRLETKLIIAATRFSLD